MVTRGWRITGRVQGVGFRWFTRREARARGLAGWVRNLPDGSVQVVVRGAEDAVAELAARLVVGPSGARVDTLEDQVPPSSAALPDPFKIM
jgi:acylphosphatase